VRRLSPHHRVPHPNASPRHPITKRTLHENDAGRFGPEVTRRRGRGPSPDADGARPPALGSLCHRRTGASGRESAPHAAESAPRSCSNRFLETQRGRSRSSASGRGRPPRAAARPLGGLSLPRTAPPAHADEMKWEGAREAAGRRRRHAKEGPPSPAPRRGGRAAAPRPAAEARKRGLSAGP
jgi:hypothetical protein